MERDLWEPLQTFDSNVLILIGGILGILPALCPLIFDPTDEAGTIIPVLQMWKLRHRGFNNLLAQRP